MKTPRRIGIFGGSFDPVHNAHCALARVALDQAQLDRVFFVVAPRPPHKLEGIWAPPEDRYALVESALQGDPAMAPSRVELDREGCSYTVDTVREFARLYPGAELFLILGMDSLGDLPRWRDPQGILAHAHVLAASRPGLSAPQDGALDGHYTLLDFEETPVSSTYVRDLIAAGGPWQDLVPPRVRDLILLKGLYRAVS